MKDMTNFLSNVKKALLMYVISTNPTMLGYMSQDEIRNIYDIR